MTPQATDKLMTFIDSWTTNSNHTKDSFMAFKSHLEGLEGIELDFVPRPGVTYSLRAAHKNQSKRSMFAMVDVIDADPDDRWLSVCFYNELVDDPNELGDEIPGGLFGEDAKCFDLYEENDDMVRYIKERLSGACLAASRE